MQFSEDDQKSVLLAMGQHLWSKTFQAPLVSVYISDRETALIPQKIFDFFRKRSLSLFAIQTFSEAV